VIRDTAERKPRIVRADDLEPTWAVKQPNKPGAMRPPITWVGGPDGRINTNPDLAVETPRSFLTLTLRTRALRLALGSATVLRMGNSWSESGPGSAP
jgi:hypothetical protein